MSILVAMISFAAGVYFAPLVGSVIANFRDVFSGGDDDDAA